MASIRRERDENATIVSSSEQILHEGRSSTTALNTMPSVGNSPILSRWLEGALEELVAPVPRARHEDTFDRLYTKLLLEKCPASNIRLTQLRSSTRLKSTARYKYAGIPALEEDEVVWNFCNVGPATESSLDRNVMAVIRTLVNSLAVKSFQSSDFHSAVQRAD